MDLTRFRVTVEVSLLLKKADMNQSDASKKIPGVYSYEIDAQTDADAIAIARSRFEKELNVEDVGAFKIDISAVSKRGLR